MKHILALVCAALLATPAVAQVERVWLSHRTTTPERVVVSWETAAPEESIIRHGASETLGHVTQLPGRRRFHQVEIPAPGEDQRLFYSVGEAADATPVASFKGMPSKQLRVAVVGNLGFGGDRSLAAIQDDDVHLLVSAGDNVPGLWRKGREGARAFSALIDLQPALFRSVPFMPALGNHDKEIAPTDSTQPRYYDIPAQAYRDFFALPDEEWCWHFDVPGYGLRLVALDINHIDEVGTSRQSTHPFDRKSPQFQWYRQLVEAGRDSPFLFTVMNERESRLNWDTRGLWREQFRRGSAVLTYTGTYAERMELDGFPVLNTSLKSRPQKDPVPDPGSKFLENQDSYILLTFERGAGEMKAELKNLRGEVLDTRIIKARQMAAPRDVRP